MGSAFCVSALRRAISQREILQYFHTYALLDLVNE